MSSRLTIVSPQSSQYHAGMRWPHHNWREIVQSRIFSSQFTYVLVKRSGTNSTSWSLTTLRAGSASGFISTNHCLDTIGSIIVLQREQWPTAWSWSSIFSSKPNSWSSATTCLRACSRGKPLNLPAPSFIVASLFITTIDSKSWRWPISKSLGSWAGVIFTQPVPKLAST